MSFALLCAVAQPMSATAGQLAPQELVPEPPLSLEQVKERLAKPPGPRLTPAKPVQLRPTFKSRVDQKALVLTLEEELHKEFDLTEFQRQSAEWRSKCCGLDLGWVFRSIEKALDERKLRKTRQQIARELAELEAARKAEAAVVK
jgi:hypothetical protein